LQQEKHTEESFRKENPVATNPVGWFEIYVDDMERAKKFYERIE
jgi:hypothetical protein